MKYAIVQKVDFTIDRQEADFDRACDGAWQRAVSIFGVDDCGHIQNVKGADRSSSSIKVEFVSYLLSIGMLGGSHTYFFRTWIENDED